MNNELMNVEQLADYVQMSRASVYHLLAESKIPGTKIGKQWRFSRATIDKWLMEKATNSASVLVVGDDSTVREVVINSLRGAGHSPIGSDTVGQSKLLLSELEFDVILLELLLPDGTGLDVVKAASQIKPVPEIVVVTGHPKHELIAEIHSLLPYTTVLNKPIRLASMLELVARTASRPRQSAK